MKFLNKDGVTYLWGKIQAALNGKQNALTFDDVPTANSTNPVASGGVYNALEAKQDAMTFDNAPTEGSDNPVKSGGLKEALDGKKNTQTAVSPPTASGNALAFIDTISQNEQGVIAATKKSVTVDATPTANSTNPVQSGGVKAALDEKLNAFGKGINLLDNWYFVGGGSQQGGGQFPINQRGQTSYSGIGYTIDRWMMDISSNVSLLPDGLKFNSGRISQTVNDFAKLLDKTVTFSALTSENVLKYTTMTFGRNNGGSWLGNMTVYSLSNGQFIIVSLLTIVAAKLELGDTQTLAHQENGVWVLNDPPPNYDMELLKCQLSTADSSDTYANRKLIPITANMGTVTGTGSTVTVSKTVTGVTADMTVDRIEFGDPSAVQSEWTVITATDSVTFSATINGSTTVKIKLSDNMDVTGT